MKKYFTACFLLLSVSSFAKIIFVKANASGANDGTSWANAYTKLQDALTTAASGNQIWVAAGTYYPDKGAGLTDNDVNLSFNLKSGVAIYGGLVGTETQLSERNWQTNVSILSGDIDGVAGNGGNSFHVVRSISVDRTAVLDGFTISGGNAVGANRGDDEGGGILSELSSPAIANCSFSGNSAANGGVIYNYFSSSDLVNCSFSGNSASQHGGALNNGNGAGGVRLVNCSFSGNSAANGGAIYSVETNLTLSNCILWGNSSEIFSDRVLPATLTNSIVQGGFAGDGNLDQDPLFVNIANGNLRLQACSPAIDAGDNSAVKVATDLDDNTRIAHTRVDMGAYEYSGTLYTFYPDADGDGYGSKTASSTRTSFCSTHSLDETTDNTDCDDDDATVNPGATETCNGIDDDCDGDVDEGVSTTFYRDSDGDGFSDASRSQSSCTRPDNYVTNNTDCNDADANINPNMVWVLDNDKDDYYAGDPVRQCTSPGTGYIIKTTQQVGDCNDNNAGIHPGAVEVCGNGIDDNCNNKTDETGCAACKNATGLNMSNITSHGATLNWTALANPLQWIIEYKKISTGSKWTSVTVPGYLRSTNLSSLLANQKYQWHISAKCGRTWTSFSDAVMFKTLSSQQANSTIAQQSLQLKNITEDKSPVVKLYPNPTRGQFVIELRLPNNINTNAKIEMVNMMGQPVSAENANISNGTLHKTVSIPPSLAQRIYMVRVLANNKTYLTRLIYEK